MLKFLGITTRISAILLFSIILHACSNNNFVGSSAYLKDGLSIQLPDTWNVLDDNQTSKDIRTLLIASDAGNILSIDVYPQLTGNQLPILPLSEYFKRIVIATTPTQQAQDSVKITYGTVNRKFGDGLFAEVKISDPESLHLFIETLRYEDQYFVVYFTFSSPMPLAPAASDVVDNIIDGFDIKKTT